MEVRLLGPVGIWTATRQATLARAHRRCVLAALAMSPGQPVSLESLIDRVWGDQPPREAAHSLYTHISAVRRVFQEIGGGAATLRRLNRAYILEIDPEHVDLHRARRYVAEARAIASDRHGREEAGIELLRRASELWRGPPLTGLGGEWAARVRQGLDHERLAMLVERFRLELRLGQHAAVIGPLGALLADYPLAEPMACLQMLALYRCGRQADALELYSRTRQRLIDELSAEPSTELQRLHKQILRRDPTLDLASNPVPAAIATAAGATHWSQPLRHHAGLPYLHRGRYDVRPAQLPAALGGFVGRDIELARLLGDQRGGRRDPSANRIYVIDGMPGVGKTTLAIYAAHQLATDHPDGQLFIDLRGFTDGLAPVDASDALEQLLRALGHRRAATQIPTQIAERAALYRSLTAGRRLLILLDNAASEEQVTPLLPGAGNSLVLVTSRRRLAGIDDAHSLSLDVLPLPAAIAAFTRAAGEQRLATEPAGLIRQVVERCARLPLAIQLAAARLRSRPTWTLAHLLERLRGQPAWITELTAGRRSLAASLQLSYRDLPVEGQRLLRMLRLLPGPEFDAGAAATLAGLTEHRADQLLENLVDANLLQSPAPGRYVLPELVRGYAVVAPAAEDDPTQLHTRDRPADPPAESASHDQPIGAGERRTRRNPAASLLEPPHARKLAGT